MAKKVHKNTMIVRVQISMDKKSILIYNQSRKYNCVLENPKEIAVIAEAMEGKIKCFFKAQFTQRPHIIELLEKVEDQNW
jgi:hypothetical protein